MKKLIVISSLVLALRAWWIREDPFLKNVDRLCDLHSRYNEDVEYNVYT